MVCAINVLFEANKGRSSISTVNMHKRKETCILLDLRGKSNSFEVVNLFFKSSQLFYSHIFESII